VSGNLVFAAPAIAEKAQDVSSVTVTATSIAEFGTPLYADMKDHFPYADPAAAKGGTVVLGALGSFDNLNPYTLRGELAGGLGMVDDSLMGGSGDELSSAYPLIAESVTYPADKSSAVFAINPKARFQDGTPITAADFVAALDAIRKPEGPPFQQSFFEAVDHLEAVDDHHLKAVFKTRDQMKPILNVATALSPLPRQYWAKHDITKTSLDPAIGSGAYRVAAVDPGRSITFERVKDYWAADLPIMKGMENFDTIRFDYYRDDQVMFEAFKAHKIDFRQENKASRWTREYDFPAVADGEVIKRAIHMDTPQGIQGLFFNMRRPQFQDIRVRQALNLLFDFETTQRTLLNGQYKRDSSYFPGSDYGATGAPSPAEIAVLTPFKEQLAPEVLTQAFELPTTDGTGNIRPNLRKALDLFHAAGWDLADGKLTHDGKPLPMEILIDQEAFVRVLQPYVDNLRRAGVDASIRLVDSAQYEERLKSFDFDTIEIKSNFFPPPGPELRSYYGSAAADVRGTGNWAGIKNPVADALIEQIVAAKDLDTLKADNRALDRVLLWQYYCVPEWYNDEAWIAYWNSFSYPRTSPRYSTGFPDTWWQKPVAAH
jgi:microcin C transport system substrate-binding protein